MSFVTTTIYLDLSSCEAGEQAICTYFRPWNRKENPCVNENNLVPGPSLTPGCSTGLRSQHELDMRRKAEILQYKQPGNQLSKKQIYSLIQRYKYFRKKSWATQNQRPSQTNPNVNNLAVGGPGELLCASDPNNPRLCNPTSSSDVPGPIKMLYLDPNIPLTMYPRVSQRTYLAGSEKWPEYKWFPGLDGFPRGKSGRSR
jgi:hypothetical protein